MRQGLKMRKHPFFRGVALALVFTLVVTMCPALAGVNNAYAATSTLTTEQPEILVTGSGVIGGSAYTADNVGLEKAYTRDELKSMKGGENVLYSSIKSQEPYTKQLSRATGVYVSSLLEGTKADLTKDMVSFVASSDGNVVSFDPAAEYKNGNRKTTGLNETRYTYAGLLDGSDADKTEALPMLAWALKSSSSKDPAAAGSEKEYCTVAVGQLAFDDMNNSLYNKYMQKVQVGDALTGTALTVGTDEYTRSDVLLMERAERTYEYTSKKGDQSDAAVGVPMSVLLKGYSDTDIVKFDTADGYGVDASGMTVKELIDGNYMLAYEVNNNGSGAEAVYEVDGDAAGFFKLYGDGFKPAKFVNKITVEKSSGIDFSTSPFKHITNGGLGADTETPYNIDAITGATLTVEGPGVKVSVPLPVRDLENRNAGAFRGDYTDIRNGVETERTYEGIDLYYVLNNMSEGSNGIIMTETAKVVELKNRNRDTVATFTMGQINAAHEAGKPILIAYGTGYTDGSKITPFVFDGGTGADKKLGNEDGCLKLVYDKSVISGDVNTEYTTFKSMAYIYVAEESTPGFKHDKEPYNTAENTQYVLTITGNEIGREVNYKVTDLEDMVQYDENGVPVADGFGYRDEYKLANNTYWYVNEYEGVKLWDLLQTAGLKADKASDDKTIVSFTARDGYTGFDKFTLKQIADPDAFGYYEKNPADNNDGKYTGAPGDLLDTGYPVLVAYGVNKYPYVIEKETDGFLSGLSNDGGPLRIISGKLNYSHANGSSQAQKLDKILVGEDTYHYSTHKYHEKDVYKKLADEKITIKVMNGSTEIKSAEYTVGQIEELIYEKLSSAQVNDAKIKGFYEADKDGSLHSDLYEGINLGYFLKNIVEIPGDKGTVTFNQGVEDEYSMDLEALLKLTDGYNTDTKLSGLAPVLAYAKNGAPMVNSKEEADGYEKEFTVGEGKYESTYTVKNNGGPLSILIPNTSKDAKDAKAVENATSITINLSADKYAHLEAPYDTYAAETLTISGEGTRLTGPTNVTVGELEAKQTIAETAVYSVLKNGADKATETRYRGVNVYKLLQQYGLKSNADKVIFTTGDGEKFEFSLSDVSRTYKNTVSGADVSMILAYGSASADNVDAEDGLPLVADKDSTGYDKAYGNNGGPLKLVVGQKDAADTNSSLMLKDVVAIEVTASATVSWDHNSAEVYKQYLDYAIDFIVFNETDPVNPIYTKKITVAEIEAMTDLVERAVIYTSSEEEWEGVHLWNMVQAQMKDVPGKFTVVGISPKQGSYGPELIGKFGETALKDGIEGKPVLLAYAVNGKPLVPGSTKTGTQNGEGFDIMAQNNGGPLRTITQKSTGTCIQELERIEVVVKAEGAVTQTDKFETSVGNGQEGELPFAGVRSVSFDKDGGMWVGTYGGGAAYKAAGADKYNVYNTKSGLATGFVSAVAADADGGVWMSQNASYTEPGKNKGVVYMDKDGKMTSYTVEANPGTIPDNYVQDIKIDAEGNVWFASFGGLTKYNPANGEWKTWTKKDNGFPAEAVTKIEFDGNGGVWLGFYPEGTDDGNGGVPFTGGFAHMSKDGKVTSYPLTAGFAANGTSKLAEVWIRDLAVAKDGSVWVIASGAYASIENVGGSVWHVASPGAKAEEYTGDQLFGTALDGADNAELRMVAADAKGGLWFGTSADGVFYAADPTVAADGTMTVTTMYNTETGSWTESGMDNVYSLDIHNGTVYAGSAAGLAWLSTPVLEESVGDATAGTADISFVGDGFVKEGYFTIKGLKNAEGLEKGEYKFFWMNSSGTTGTSVVEGASMKNILKDLMGITDDAKSITFVCSDGYSKTMPLDDMFVKDKDGNRPVLAWNVDGSKDGTPTFVIGQTAADDNNKSKWMKEIVKVEVTTADPGTPDTPVTPDEPVEGDTVGDATAETADLSIVGNGMVKEGYFTIKGLKNAEGIEKETVSFTWQNSSGTTGTSEIEGASVKNIIKDILGITDAADTIIFTCKDGYAKEMPLNDMFTKDKDGQRPYLAWKVDGEKCDPTLIIGQAADGDVNKSKWLKEIVKIEVKESGAVEEPDTPVVPDEPADKESVGDATADNADLTVAGNGLVKDGYFSIKGLKNAEGIEKETVSFTWQNSSGTTGISEIEGASMKNILKDILGLTDDADTITFTCKDGFAKSMPLDDMFAKDKDGQRPYLAWKVDGEKCDPTLIIGQSADGDVNKSKWMKEIVKIEVTAPAAPGAEIEGTSVGTVKVGLNNLTKNRANIAVSWNKVEAADKYKVELFRNGVKVNTVYRADTKATLTFYKRGYEYTVKVTPYIIDGENYYHGNTVAKKVTSKHGAATLSVAKNGNYRVIKSADRNSTGFEVMITANGKSKTYKFVTNGNKLNKKVLASKYFAKGTNKVKVRAYTTYNNVTVKGNWSAVKNVVR